MAHSTVPAITKDPDRSASAAGGDTGRSGRPVAVSLLISLRPAQWTKNLIVFAGLMLRRSGTAAILDSQRSARRSAAFVDLLRAVGRRLSDQRRRRSRGGPACIRSSAIVRSRRARSRRASAIGTALVLAVGDADRRVPAAAGVRAGRGELLVLLGVLLGPAEAHRDPRRADDRDRLRAARGRRRGGDRRADQPLAAAPDAARRAVPGAEQAPRTSWCCSPTARPGTGRSSRSTARTCSIR